VWSSHIRVPLILTYLLPVPSRGPHLMRPSAHQLVDGNHYLRELCAGYATVAIYIIQFKRPAQLLIDRPTEQSGQRH
jgi:hypothetical protein